MNSLLSALENSSATGFTLIVCSGVLVFYYLFIKKSRVDKLLDKIGGPPKVFFFGNALHFLGPKEEALPKMIAFSEKYGRRFTTKMGTQRFVSLWDADDVEKLLSSQTHIAKGSDYDVIMPWLGTGLLTSKGHKWFTRRKMLTPAFHFKILEDFMGVFNHHSETMVKILQDECTGGNVFDICPYVTRCTLDIICETAMGKKINAQYDRNSEYITAIHRLGKILQIRAISPWYWIEFVWRLSALGKEEKTHLKTLHGFTEKVIAERKKEYIANLRNESSLQSAKKQDDVSMGVKRRLAFMDLLLEAQHKGDKDKDNTLTDTDIREETDTFMFEGHDTTAASVNYTIFLFGCYPEVQAKAQEELDEIFGEDRERPVTPQDLTRMKYLECCLKESLRLYPSVPFIERAINSDFTLGDGTVIPAGVSTFVFIYRLHRDEKNFPQPLEFRPERFFLENADANRSPFAYIPFSAGPRNCIGQKFAMMEEKVMIANVLRKFNIQAAETRDDLRLLTEMILRPQDGLKIKLSLRE